MLKGDTCPVWYGFGLASAAGARPHRNSADPAATAAN
jgi:hypothetical protein